MIGKVIKNNYRIINEVATKSWSLGQLLTERGEVG